MVLGRRTALRQSWQPWLARIMVVAVVAAVLALGSARLPAARLLESWLLDSCFVRRGLRETSAKIVLIGIDDASLESMDYPLVYISPDLAKVVRFLREQNAAAIGIDLLVPDYLRDLPGIAPPDYDADADTGLSEIGDRAPDGNPAPLREEIHRAGNVVLIEYIDVGRAIKPLPAWHLSRPDKNRADDELVTDLTCVALTEDPDYVARWQALWFSVQERADGQAIARPHLALALAAVAEKRTVRFDNQQHLLLEDEVLPTNERGQLEINYLGPTGSVPSIAFRDVVEGRVTEQEKSLVHGAVAIIGVTARSQKDHVFTPYSDRLIRWSATGAPPLMPGAELHANILATLSDRAFLWRFSWAWEAAMLLAASLGLGFAHVKWGVVRSAAAATVLATAWWIAGTETLRRFYLALPMTSMLLVIGLSVVAAGYQHLWWMRRLLGAVKSRQIARVLESNKGLFAMRGEQRLATILFADVRGFSDFSKPESPHTVTRLLNAYFGAVVPIIERHGGVINQYMGDGVMVLFNLPDPLESHALCAVRAAVEMIERVRSMADVWKECGLGDMRIGIGINTGLAVAGVVGSPRRLDYTAIGDAVNAAARIEAANKDLGTDILISDSTYKELTPQERIQFCRGEPPQSRELKGVGPRNLYTVYI